MGVQAEKRCWNLGTDWTKHCPLENLAFLNAAGDEDEFAAIEDCLDAHGDRSFRHARLSTEIGFVRLSRRFSQPQTMSPARADRSRFVESYMTVAADTQDCQVQSAIALNQIVVVIALLWIESILDRQVGVFEQILLQEMLESHAAVGWVDVFIQLETACTAPVERAHLRPLREKAVAA